MNASKLRRSWVALVLLLPLFGCGGGGGTDSGACADPTFTTLSGTWQVTENPVSNCGDDFQDVYNVTLTQNGSAIQVVAPNGHSYSGVMCGNVIRANVPYSFADTGGTTTVSSTVITVNSNSSASFVSVWTWTDGVDSCNGTTTGPISRP